MKKGLVGGLILLVVIGVVAFAMANRTDDMVTNEMNNESKEMMSDVESMDESSMTEEKMDSHEDPMEEEKMSDEMTKTDDMKMMNTGEMAPTFDLMSLSGDQVSLESLQGQKVYIKFWASWCSICLAGLDELDELSMSEEIAVYTIVSPGQNGEKDQEEFIAWFEGLGYQNIQVLLDDTGDVLRDYGVRGFPTSAYIGSDGILIKTLPGHVSNEIIMDAFRNIY